METRAEVVGCGGCGTRSRLKDHRDVSLVGLAAFGRPAVLVRHKRRWSCPDLDCEEGTFTEVNWRIAAPRAKLAGLAGQWATVQVGREGRTVAEFAAEYLNELTDNMADEPMPVEVRSLAGTPKRSRNQILAWHSARVTNGPAESMNNLINKFQRVGHGFGNVANYRNRALLYTGRPNWSPLATVTPR